MEQPQIDWDVVLFEYDPDARDIHVHNWDKGDPDAGPLPLANVTKYAPRKLDRYIDTFARRLVDLANEKLAADQLARSNPKGPEQ